MSAGVVAFPLLAAVFVVACATSAHGRLPPRLAARFVTIALVVVVVAAVPTTLVFGLAYLAHAPIVGVGIQWCARAVGLHQSVPAWIGVPIVLLIVVGALRAGRVVRDHRRLRVHAPHPIRVAPSDKPYAVTLPGPAGQIVISSAMVDLLDDTERWIVLAHERAHARLRHDRYLLVAELAAAALPPLRSLSNRLRYSIERWADEAAAAACGDRRLVATTLGRVALQASPATVNGFGGLGVASRMNALLEPPVQTPRPSRLIALWSTLAVAAALAAYQLHHLERLLTALCPH
jgi:Zn-dependent protease with chaperone function